MSSTTFPPEMRGVRLWRFDGAPHLPAPTGVGLKVCGPVMELHVVEEYANNMLVINTPTVNNSRSGLSNQIVRSHNCLLVLWMGGLWGCGGVGVRSMRRHDVRERCQLSVRVGLFSMALYAGYKKLPAELFNALNFYNGSHWASQHSQTCDLLCTLQRQLDQISCSIRCKLCSGCSSSCSDTGPSKPDTLTYDWDILWFYQFLFKNAF